MLYSLNNAHLNRYYAPNFSLYTNTRGRNYTVNSFEMISLAYYYALIYDPYKRTERLFFSVFENSYEW